MTYLRHRTYTVNQTENNLLEWEEKKFVRAGVWYIGGEKRYRKRRGKGFPMGLLASAAAQLLGEVAKPILTKIFGGRQKTRWRCDKK